MSAWTGQKSKPSSSVTTRNSRASNQGASPRASTRSKPTLGSASEAPVLEMGPDGAFHTAEAERGAAQVRVRPRGAGVTAAAAGGADESYYADAYDALRQAQEIGAARHDTLREHLAALGGLGAVSVMPMALAEIIVRCTGCGRPASAAVDLAGIPLAICKRCTRRGAATLGLGLVGYFFGKGA